MTHEVPSSLPPADAAAPRGGDPARAPGAGPGPAERPATAPAVPGSGSGPATTGPATGQPPRADPAPPAAATTSPATGSATSGPAAAEEADVIVVGAGPAGSATACYLARAGVDVLVLEKACFPREKVCGDGLTPRAVKALVGMGVPDRRAGRLGPEQGPADHRRRGPARASLAGTVQLSRLRAGPDPARLRRDPRPHGAEGGRTAPRRRDRDRAGTGRGRPDRGSQGAIVGRRGGARGGPAAARGCGGAPGQRAGAQLPRPGDRRGGREFVPAVRWRWG